MLLFVSREVLKEFVTNSGVIMNWSITITGATFLAIISNGFYKPVHKKRLLYLLLFPAWSLLGVSIYHAVAILNAYAGTAFTNPASTHLVEDLFPYGVIINDSYASQIDYFYMGVGVIMIWFVAIVLSWIFEKANDKSPEQTVTIAKTIKISSLKSKFKIPKT